MKFLTKKKQLLPNFRYRFGWAFFQKLDREKLRSTIVIKNMADCIECGQSGFRHTSYCVAVN